MRKDHRSRAHGTWKLHLIGSLIFLRFICDGVLKFRLVDQEITTIIAAFLAFIAILSLALRFSNWIEFFLFFSILLTSSLLGFDRWGYSGVEEAVRTLAVFGLYIFAIEYLNYSNIVSLIRLYCYLMCANSFFVIWQLSQGTGIRIDGVERYSGFIAHPNSSAIMAGSALVLIQSLRKEIELKRTYLCQVLISISLLFSLSFMGLITFGVMSACAYIMIFPSIRRVVKIGFYGTLSTLGLFMLNSGFRHRFTQFTTSNEFQSGSESNSLQWRLERWRILLHFWEEKPLFGQGYGTSTSGLMLNDAVPHNEYLRLLVEIGIFGLFLVIVLYFFRVQYFYRIVKGSRTPEAIAISCLLVGGALNAITENTFQYTLWVIFLFLVMALAEKRIEMIYSKVK